MTSLFPLLAFFTEQWYISLRRYSPNCCLNAEQLHSFLKKKIDSHIIYPFTPLLLFTASLVIFTFPITAFLLYDIVRVSVQLRVITHFTSQLSGAFKAFPLLLVGSVPHPAFPHGQLNILRSERMKTTLQLNLIISLGLVLYSLCWSSAFCAHILPFLCSCVGVRFS